MPLSGALGRLPRTRGDRPLKVLVHGRDGEATPHTRGSTHMLLKDARLHFGYPAHAGIDLLLECKYCIVRRLPRTRGDRP